MATMNILEAALEYADNGWGVIPVRRDKRPITQNGSKDWSRDPDVIRAWWEKWPQANVAICTGKEPSGLAVVDIDSAAGFPALEALGIDLDASRQAKTGRDGVGVHIFYRIPDGVTVRNAAKIVDGVDVRGEGGFVIVAPSVHTSGRQYEWANDEPLEDFPAVLLGKRQGKILSLTDARQGSSDLSGGIGEGSRNDTLFRWACKKRGEGATEEDLGLMIESANRKYCKPPLPDDEIADMAARICREYPQGNASGLYIPSDSEAAKRWAESQALPLPLAKEVQEVVEKVSQAKAERGDDEWQVLDIVRRVIDEDGGCRFSLTVKLGDRQMTMRGIPAAEMLKYGSLAARALGTANGFAWPEGKVKAKELMTAIREHMAAGIREEQGASEESASALAYAHLIDHALQLQETEEREKMMADNGDLRYYDETLDKWLIAGEAARHMVKSQVPDANKETLAAAFRRAEGESVRITVRGLQRRFTAIKLPKAEQKLTSAKMLA